MLTPLVSPGCKSVRVDNQTNRQRYTGNRTASWLLSDIRCRTSFCRRKFMLTKVWLFGSYLNIAGASLNSLVHRLDFSLFCLHSSEIVTATFTLARLVDEDSGRCLCALWHRQEGLAPIMVESAFQLPASGWLHFMLVFSMVEAVRFLCCAYPFYFPLPFLSRY